MINARRFGLALCIHLGFFHGMAAADAWDLKIGAGPVLRAGLDSQHSSGFGCIAFGELGLTRFVSLSATAGLSYHPDTTNDDSLLPVVDIGIYYSLDVFAVVPFAGIRSGWYLDEPGISLVLGADYLWTEYFFAGVSLEAHESIERFSFLPNHTSLVLRFGYRILD